VGQPGPEILKGPDCGQCKAFGAKNIHAHIAPITRHHPFEFMVTDYLSMLVRKGGFKMGLVMLG
jgi:hypothetical protein